MDVYAASLKTWPVEVRIRDMVDSCMGVIDNVKVRDTDCRAALVHKNGVLALRQNDFIWSKGKLTKVADLDKPLSLPQ